MEHLYVGLTGYARSGKDTICKHLKEELNKRGIPFERFALADSLKEEVSEFCSDNYFINPISCSDQQKEKIRPFLIFHGNLKRELSDGSYWCMKLDQKIRYSHKIDKPHIICITDIRYAELEYDELNWLKDHKHSYLIYINRLLECGNPLVSQIPEELKNIPIIRTQADKIFDYPTFSLEKDQKDAIIQLADLLGELFNNVS
jgi:hypothetical protein